jgi:hypothetical protein
MKLAVFLLLLLLSICPGNNSNQTGKDSPAREAALNQKFKIGLGEDVVLKGEDLMMRFLSVLEDSRCPKGEQCITAGKGKIELRLKKLQKEPSTLELNTSSETQAATYEGYEVKIVALDPYPKMGGNIKRADYVLTVVVSKHASARVSSMALLCLLASNF